MNRRFPKAPRAVITGSGSGLGRAIALRLAQRQARILVADIDAERAKQTALDVVAAGGQARTVHCDVSKLEDVERAAARSDELWGGTDILVNNAGVAAAGFVGEMPIEDWAWVLQVDLWGAIHGCHAFLPGMKRRGGGFILNVASCAGLVSLPEMAAYNVAKAAVIALSETVAAEAAADQVRVSVLCPTFVKTNLMDSFRSSQERQKRLATALFRRSTMTAEQVAALAVRGLEQGKLVVVPQRDGAWLWRLKRLSPSLYGWLLRNVHGRGWMDRALLPERAETA